VTTLLTGATGFVGSAVARCLLDAGHSLRVLVRPCADRRNLQGLEVETCAGDLRDPDSLRTAVRGCRHLFHVAADYRLWTADPQDLYRSNVQGTRDLLRLAAEAGVERIVYTSSVATLGRRADGLPADEATPSRLADMVGHYKRSKYLAEEEVRQLAREEGVPVVIVNPSAPVGPRDVKPTPTGKVILDAMHGRIPMVVDTGLNVVHVDDVAAGHLGALEHGKVGERYVLGGENMTLQALLAEVCRLCERRAPTLCVPHHLVLPAAWACEAWARLTHGEPRISVDAVRMSRHKMYFSSDKARHALGYRARPATTGITDAVTWFREAGYP